LRKFQLQLLKKSVNNKPRAGSRVVRIDTLHFLDGYRKRRLNQVLSVLSLRIRFLTFVVIRTPFCVPFI